MLLTTFKQENSTKTPTIIPVAAGKGGMDNGGSVFNTLDLYGIGPCGVMVTTPDYPAIVGMLGFLKQHLLRLIERRTPTCRKVHLLLKEIFNAPADKQIPSISELCQQIEAQDPQTADHVRSAYRKCCPRLVLNRGRKPEDSTVAQKIIGLPIKPCTAATRCPSLSMPRIRLLGDCPFHDPKRSGYFGSWPNIVMP